MVQFKQGFQRFIFILINANYFAGKIRKNGVCAEWTLHEIYVLKTINILETACDE
jgi:hypothetical protein